MYNAIRIFALTDYMENIKINYLYLPIKNFV